jgi:hypothetical protein
MHPQNIPKEEQEICMLKWGVDKSSQKIRDGGLD